MPAFQYIKSMILYKDRFPRAAPPIKCICGSRRGRGGGAPKLSITIISIVDIDIRKFSFCFFQVYTSISKTSDQFLEKSKAHRYDSEIKVCVLPNPSPREICIVIKVAGVLEAIRMKLYRRISVIPVRSDTVERSFSTIRRMKTYN